ncbi:hypothetical protein Tco_0010363 [Tanacetum coccineum]
MFFWVDDALVPWNFAFYTQGLLPRDERPPPGSYSMEDAELINENRIPINAYSEAFLCHHGISCNYSKAPRIFVFDGRPFFIGDDGRVGCLVVPFLLHHLVVRTMELVLEQPKVESTDVLAPTPLRSVPSATVEPPRPDATSVGSSEDADVSEMSRYFIDFLCAVVGVRMMRCPTPTGPQAIRGFMPVIQHRDEGDLMLLKIQLHMRCVWQIRVFEVLCTEPCRGKNGTACQGRARARGCCGVQGKLSLGCEVLGGGVRTIILWLDDFRQNCGGDVGRSGGEVTQTRTVYARCCTLHVVNGLLERRKAACELHEKMLMIVPAAHRVRQSYVVLVIAHLPRSDGVQFSVATVSPKDSELLRKLREVEIMRTMLAVQRRSLSPF